MPEWKDNGIIIKCGHFHEADLWLKMLLKNHGLVTVFAFGGARSRKRFCGCLDVLNALSVRIHLNRTKEYLVLEEALLLSGPRNLRSQWRKMGLMANCLKFLDALAIGPDVSVESYDFLQGFRDTFELGQPLLAQYFFRLRMAHILGFSPSLHACAQCGSSQMKQAIFVAPQGYVLCGECSKDMNSYDRRFATGISENTRNRLQHVLAFPALTWPEDGLEAVEQRQCGQLIDSFIQFHMGLEWQNGIFKKV